MTESNTLTGFNSFVMFVLFFSFLSCVLCCCVGKPILVANAMDIVTVLKDCIADESRYEDCCSLCYSDCPIDKLRSPCGLACECLCCVECLSHWYSQNKVGALYLESHSICPFCRSAPTYKTLKPFNPRLSGIEGRTNSSVELDRHMYHAWCMGCGQVKPALPRECAGGELPEILNFNCTACQDNRRFKMNVHLQRINQMMGGVGNLEMQQLLLRLEEAVANKESMHIIDGVVNQIQELQSKLGQSKLQSTFKECSPNTTMLLNLLKQGGKQCPQCCAAIEKDGGCNHMQCGNCNGHFCWLCLKIFVSADECYTHLHKTDNDCRLFTGD